MMNDKCRLVFQLTVIFLLCILFIGSITYTLAVYFTIGKETVQTDLQLNEVCRPYADLSNVPQTDISGIILTSLSVEEIYLNHPSCLDALLPVICQLLYPLIVIDSDVSSSGVGDIGFINTLLLNDCISIIPDQSLLLLASLPTVYYQNITCADGFYQLNNTCRPHCTQFEQIDHKSAKTKIVFWYITTILTGVFIVVFVVTVCFKRKTMFKFPSIFFIYIVVLYSLWPMGILINLISGRDLVCSDDDLVKSLDEPSLYCIITGILNAGGVILTWVWFVLVAVMFWKVIFPLNAHHYHNWEKWIHIFTLVVAVAYLIPFVVVTTVHEDFYFIQIEFPSFFCLSRNSDFFVLYLLFPAAFLGNLGVFLLIVMLFRIQMKYGCSIWRSNDAINTAEKKILLLLCVVGGITILSGIYYTVLLSGGNELQAALNSYLLCELPGYIMDNENDMTTCSKDEIEKYSYTGLSIAYIVVNYPLLLLVFLLTIIEWKSFIQKVKELLHMKNNELTASNLAQLNKCNEVSNTVTLENSSADTK